MRRYGERAFRCETTSCRSAQPNHIGVERCEEDASDNGRPQRGADHARRNGRARVTYPHPSLEAILRGTSLGVTILVGFILAAIVMGVLYPLYSGLGSIMSQG